MDIAKTALNGGSDLATRYGQKTQIDESRPSATAGGGAAAKPALAPGGEAPLVELSPEALERAELSEALASARAEYDALPETRADVLAAVRQRIADGYYESAEGRSALADRLVDVARAWRAAKA